MKIHILTDSSADFEQEELIQKDIICVPLTITFGNESFLDGAELAKDDFYTRLLKRETFPTTAQPSPEAFLEHFKKAKENGDAVICILLSSGLSGTVQSATIAKGMIDYDQIYVIDSLTATTAIRLLVDIACGLREEGRDAASLAQEITALVARAKIIAMIDTLEYLHRGGRLTKTQAKMGSLVNLKPIITLNSQGKIDVIDKCLGFSRAIKSIQKLFEKHPYDERYPVYLPFAHDKTNGLKLVSEAEKKWPVVDAKHLYNIGPTIGTHTGAGAFGFAYIEKE